MCVMNQEAYGSRDVSPLTRRSRSALILLESIVGDTGLLEGEELEEMQSVKEEKAREREREKG